MQRTLQDHIASLEQKVARLKAEQDDMNRTSEERYQAALDLDTATKALAHFRTAYELEQQIQN